MWKKCYKVSRTVLILLNVVTPARLDAYEERIWRYVQTFPDTAWGLIYQADVRMRSERMERLRRRAARDHAAAQATGGTTAFNPAKPWDHVWTLAVNDK